MHGGDDDLRLELALHPDGADPTEAAVPPITVIRRVRAGRRVLLTLPAHHAREAVAWAASLRDTDRVESYSLTPATLEDAYLALTGLSAELEATDV